MRTTRKKAPARCGIMQWPAGKHYGEGTPCSFTVGHDGPHSLTAPTSPIPARSHTTGELGAEVNPVALSQSDFDYCDRHGLDPKAFAKTRAEELARIAEAKS